MTRAIVSVAVIAAIVYAARSFAPGEASVTGSGAALAFGFLLIAAILFAHIARALHLPELTGYMLCGLLFGPDLIGLVSRKMLSDLTLINGVAVGLIAFLAGCQLNFRKLRPQIRAISAVSLISMVSAGLLIFGFLYLMTFVLPIAQQFTNAQRIALALIGANVLSAFSPAVVIGVIAETRASGPLSELCLSSVVVADLVRVVTFALAITWGHRTFATAAIGQTSDLLLPHLFGSIAVGAGIGLLLTIYVRRIGVRTGLFALALIFVAAEAGRALNLNPLLVGLAAGLLLENASPVGGAEASRATEAVSLPTFAIFFSVVGAELHLRAFLHAAPFALIAAALRALGIFVGASVATRLASVAPTIRRLVPLGLLPQAGVAIGLVVLVVREFPEWGGVLGTILLGSIVVNEMIGPVLFRIALLKAGEAQTLATDLADARAVTAHR